MSVIPFSPKDEGPGAGLAGSIEEARAALARAADAPSMQREPYRMVLVGLAASLDAMDMFVDRLSHPPMDAELRDKIAAAVKAVYEREARLERQDRLALSRTGAWNGWRRRALIGAGIALMLLGAGAGVYGVGWSRGGAARMAELCQGEAVRVQDGGVTCSFWTALPPRKGAAGR